MAIVELSTSSATQDWLKTPTSPRKMPQLVNITVTVTVFFLVKSLSTADYNGNYDCVS